MEVWKAIDGTDGKYSVSNLGNVKRNEHYTKVMPNKQNPNGQVAYYKERLLKGNKNKEGYVVYSLHVGPNNVIVKKAHRLVAEAFIPNPNNLPYINHKDENPSNNSVDNLEWCTLEYNNNYGSRKEKLRRASGIKVAQYDLNGNLIKVWNSITEASRSFGCKTTANIRRVCKQVPGRKTYRGFIWRYAEQRIVGGKFYENQISENKDELIDFLLSTFSKDDLVYISDRILQSINNIE